MERVKEFSLFFGIQFLQYFLITVNLRAATQGLYGWTFLSDLLVATNGFLLIRRVANATGNTALIGYSLGGAFGSLLAIWITKILYGG